jgi:hypothetical protein
METNGAGYIGGRKIGSGNRTLAAASLASRKHVGFRNPQKRADNFVSAVRSLIVRWPVFLTLFVLVFARAARAEPATQVTGSNERASFALIIGVNKSVDADAPLLRYADDDAARYLDFFRALGARSYVLTRLDENTRRVHQQVAAEAEAPVMAEFEKAIQALASDIGQARQRNVKTALYFVYAGHGNVRDGHGYVTLEDARIDGAMLESEVLTKVNADQTHFIVDACYSYFLAMGRSPGGQRHEVHGFTEFSGLASRENVGLLFSTSSAKESHEWAGFQAGVFSHEVRSGLYGAADANGDGQVSYREIAAFIDRANAAIANEKYRSEVFAHPPKNTDILMDLRNRTSARVDLRGARSDHYYLEDSRGIRFADFHNGDDQSAYLLRPLSAGRLYLRRSSDDSEFVIPSSPQVVALADLPIQEPRMTTRGAANDAFQSLFALPFGQRVVDGFHLGPILPVDGTSRVVTRDTGGGSRFRSYAGLGLVSAGVIGAAASIYGLESAAALNRSLGEGGSGKDVADVNDRVRSRTVLSAVGLGAAGAAAAGGILLMLWPEGHSNVAWDPGDHAASVTVHGNF